MKPPTTFHYGIGPAPVKALSTSGQRCQMARASTQDDLAGVMTYGQGSCSEAVETPFLLGHSLAPHFSPLHTFPIHIGDPGCSPVLTNVLPRCPGWRRPC